MPLRLALAAGLALITQVWPQSPQSPHWASEVYPGQFPPGLQDPQGLQVPQAGQWLSLAPQFPQGDCADGSFSAMANPLLRKGTEQEEGLVQQFNDAYVSAAADAKYQAEQAAAAMQGVQEEFHFHKRAVKLEYALAMIKKAEVYREVAQRMAQVQSSAAWQAEKASGAFGRVQEISREKGDAAQRLIETLESQLQGQMKAKDLAQQSAQVQGIDPAAIMQYQAFFQGHVQAEQVLQDKLNAAIAFRDAAGEHVQASGRAAALSHTAATAHVRAAKASSESAGEFEQSLEVGQALLAKAQGEYDAYVRELAARHPPPAPPPVAEFVALPVAELAAPPWQVPQVPQMPQVPQPQYPQELQATMGDLSSHRSPHSGLELPPYAGLAHPPATSSATAAVCGGLEPPPY